MALDNQFDSWDLTTPHYELEPIRSRKLRMMISIGTSVIVKQGNPITNENNEDDEVTIATIVSLASDSKIVCVTYQTIDKLSSNTSISPIPIGVGYGLQEVVKTRNKIIVTIEDVVDFAFIFRINNLDEDVIEYGGIRNCFLLRYQYENDQLEDVQHFLCFPCDSCHHTFWDRSSMAIVWHGICCVQDALWKALNSVSERQVTSVRVPLRIDALLMEYLRYRCEGVVTQQSLKVPGRRRTITIKGMKRYTKRAKRNVSMLRFETASHLNLLRKIIGDACTIGVRRRRPKLGCSDQIRFNDAINLILGSENMATTKQHVCHNSIDIVTDQYESYMCVRYSCYLYNDKGLSNEFTNVTADEYISYMMSSINYNIKHNTSRSVRVGQYFSRGENTLLQVASIENGAARIVYLEPDDIFGKELIETNLDALSNEIKQYNSIE